MSNSELTLLNRILALWPTKLWLGVLLTIVFLTGYFGIEYHPLRPAVQLAPTVIDQMIPFQLGWVWIYQSIDPMLLLACLAHTTQQLRQYTIGLLIIMVTGFACFALWPTALPRPAAPDSPMYRLVVRFDLPVNCCPSMHLALATYTACFAIAVTTGRLRSMLMVMLPVWVILIGYSALAMKQHYWVDVPSGIFLGWISKQVAFAPFYLPASGITKSSLE